MRILVIEDNPRVSESVRKGLTEQSYSVDVADRGFDGETLAVHHPYDVIVLDLMLPDRDGVDVCRNLRRRGVQTPILMLTALSDTTDKVAGLEAGADDYLAKPFEFEELLARLRALMRRGQATEATKLTCDDLTLDLLDHSANRAGQKIELSAKEFALLEFLMRSPNRVLSRATIGEKVWDMNYEPTSNVIDVYISALRKKIDRPFGRPLIHTVIGSGYRFGILEEEAVARR